MLLQSTTLDNISVKGDARAVIVQILDNGDRLFERLDQGYVPVVGEFDPGHWHTANVGRPTAQQLAALLAMKSVELVLPRFKGAHPETILEARDRVLSQIAATFLVSDAEADSQVPAFSNQGFHDINRSSSRGR